VSFVCVTAEPLAPEAQLWARMAWKGPPSVSSERDSCPDRSAATHLTKSPYAESCVTVCNVIAQGPAGREETTGLAGRPAVPGSTQGLARLIARRRTSASSGKSATDRPGGLGEANREEPSRLARREGSRCEASAEGGDATTASKGTMARRRVGHHHIGQT
jgi:hypothetical protein